MIDVSFTRPIRPIACHSNQTLVTKMVRMTSTRDSQLTPPALASSRTTSPPLKPAYRHLQFFLAHSPFRCIVPRHEAEAEAVVDHGETAPGKLGGADQFASQAAAGPDGVQSWPLAVAMVRPTRPISQASRRWTRLRGARMRPWPRSCASPLRTRTCLWRSMARFTSSPKPASHRVGLPCLLNSLSSQVAPT